MKLSALKNYLTQVDQLHVCLPNGLQIPSHFHITEMGLLSKHFVDCGGTVRKEHHVSFQIWVAGDVDHRLDAKKLLNIIEHGEKLLNDQDLDIEIEYQGETIGKYALEIVEGGLQLMSTFTNCLAQDHCGIPKEKMKLPLEALASSTESCCTPGGGCC